MKIKKIKINAETIWWLGLFLFFAFFHSNHPLNSDEGIILDGAWSLFNGRELYAEAVHYIPPGNFYLVFILWKIFGVHYLVAKFAYVVLAFASGIGIYKISRKIYDHNFALLTPLPFFISSFAWPLINHNTANIFFIIWSIYFFILGLENQDKKYFIGSGVMTGIGILFLQHKSGALLIGLLGFLFFLYIKEKEIKIIKNSFYYLLFSLLPLLALLNWPFRNLYYCFYFFLANSYREYNQVSPWLFFLVLTFLFIYVLILKKRIGRKIALLLCGQAILLVLAYWQRPDFYHISLVLFPLYALTPLVIFESNKKRWMLKISFQIVGGVVFLVIGLSAATYITVFPPFSSSTKNFIKIIKANCQESPYLYAGPFLPGLYFETKKINPTPFYILTINSQDLKTGSESNASLKQYHQAEEAIKKTPPVCVVVNYKMMEKFNYEVDNPVDNFIKNNYTLIDRYGSSLLLKLRNVSF